MAEFGIRFQTDGSDTCTKVQVVVDSGLPVLQSRFNFPYDTGHQYAACLLARELQSRLEKAIGAAHRLAYAQGYTAGRRKQKRATLFAEGFTDKPCW